MFAAAQNQWQWYLFALPVSYGIPLFIAHTFVLVHIWLNVLSAAVCIHAISI